MGTMPQYLCILVFIILCSSLGVSMVQAETVSLLDDRLFDHGLRVTATSVFERPLYGKTVLAADATGESRWNLCQWASRFSLADVTPDFLPDGAVRLANPGMSVTWNREQEALTLSVEGNCEYEGRLRKSGEAWPHLLIEQQYSRPIRIADLNDFTLQLEFNVTTCQIPPSLTVDPGLHTAQLSAFWTVHDIDEEGRSRDMIWLGVPLFDARFDIPPPHHALDVGKEDATLKFIYLIDGREFWNEPIAVGKWHRLNRDIKPLLSGALSKSQQEGHILNASMESLAVTSFNLGWEVPGPYDCSVQIRGLNVTTTKHE